MTKLFEPLTVGSTKLDHRVAMAPLTRYRFDDDWVAPPIVQEYYEQRACVPGTLLISEATLVSRRSAGSRNVSAIWSDAQVDGWKRVTDSIHERGCKVFCQLWHQGRTADPSVLDGPLLSSSAVPMDEKSPVPEEMTEKDIAEAIGDFVNGAKNAIKAGFDGVEIHGANGYLVDQFIQDTCNKRTDGWGGGIENRSKFAVELTKAVIAAIGADKTAIRLSPYSDWQGMMMDEPEPTFKHLLEQLKPLNLAYLHLIEARIRGNDDADCGARKSVDWMVHVWANASPVLIAGGFTPESAKTAVDEQYKEYDVSIVFGRYFVANPDLVYRVQSGIELSKYERTYFYTPKITKGYIDYPFSQQYLATQQVS